MADILQQNGASFHLLSGQKLRFFFGVVQQPRFLFIRSVPDRHIVHTESGKLSTPKTGNKATRATIPFTPNRVYQLNTLTVNTEEKSFKNEYPRHVYGEGRNEESP